MFTQLIASRPTDRQKATDPRSLAFSVLLHASVIAALVLASKQVETYVQPVETVTTPIFLPPQPKPAPTAAPRAPRALATPTEAAPRLPAVALPIAAPSEIPTSIPAPSESALEPVFTGGGSDVGVSRDGAPGTPTVGDHGAYEGEQVDVPAELLKRSPLPKYPDGLRGLAIEGGARVRFVVDTLGRVETSTFEVLESSHPAFAMAVRGALPRMRFKAARIGARPVRQLVEFPITFKLDGRP